MEKIFKNIQKPIITNILVGILLLCTFFLTYFYFKNKSSNSKFGELAPTVNEINNINKNMASIKVDVNALQISVDTFNKDVDRLIELKTSISNSKNKNDLYRNLEQALNSNILFYKQLLSIMSNPKAKDIYDSFSNLHKFKEEAIKYYKLCDITKSKAPFPKYTIDSLNKCYNNFNELLKSQRDSDIKNVQNSEFKLTLEAILRRFQPLMQDVEPKLERCRTGEYNYEVLLNELDNNINTFESIQKEFYALTVPPKAIDTYKNFSDVLTVYDLYIKSLRASVNNEKITSKSKSLDKESLNIMYEGALERYEDLKNTFDGFSSTYSDFLKEIQ